MGPAGVGQISNHKQLANHPTAQSLLLLVSLLRDFPESCDVEPYRSVCQKGQGAGTLPGPHHQHPSSQRSGIHWDSEPINLHCLTRLALCGAQEYPAAFVGEHTDPRWVQKPLNKTVTLLLSGKSSNNCEQNIENLLYPHFPLLKKKVIGLLF